MSRGAWPACSWRVLLPLPRLRRLCLPMIESSSKAGALVEVARTGFFSILLHPLRSTATIICVVAVLLPFLAGLGLSKGIQQQAEESIDLGTDLYVSGQQFGRSVPVPLTALATLEGLDGVTRV